MTNEERQRAIEWMKGRPVMMAGAKRMYDLAVEALEAYVPDMNDGNMDPSRESNTEITRCSDDTISRQAAIERIRATGYVDQIKDNLIWLLRLLPSAQPVQPNHNADVSKMEIIRCKDCKFYGRADKRRFYRGSDCLNKRIDTIVPDRDFCSRAEKRGETE